MKRRARLIAGIFALVAMTLSLAETVLASTCAPGTGMAMSEMAEAPASPDDCMSAISQAGERRDTDDHERDCPFGPAVAAGCAAVASLPSHVTNAFPPHLHDERAAFAEPSEHDLLLANALFHPPRA